MKKTPKIKPITFRNEAHRIADCGTFEITNSLPDKVLRELAKNYGAPIKKLKADTACEVATALIAAKTPITITIG